jgi:hypothetical protein
MGAAARRQGNCASARSLWERSLNLQRELGQQEGVAVALVTLGAPVEAEGDDRRALELIQEGLWLSERLGLRGQFHRSRRRIVQAATGVSWRKVGWRAVVAVLPAVVR